MVTKPLTCLTGKVDWAWGPEERATFEELKRRIAEDVTLFIPTDDGPYCAETNSLDYANGGCLSQKVNSVWRPVAFRSQSLNEVERNYEIYDKEMMG